MSTKSKYIWYWAKQPWPAIEVDLSATEENDRSVCAKKFTAFIVNQRRNDGRRWRELGVYYILKSWRDERHQITWAGASTTVPNDAINLEKDLFQWLNIDFTTLLLALWPEGVKFRLGVRKAMAIEFLASLAATNERKNANPQRQDDDDDARWWLCWSGLVSVDEWPWHKNIVTFSSIVIHLYTNLPYIYDYVPIPKDNIVCELGIIHITRISPA